ncbi:MAG: hypothetical protein V8R49_10460 [Duodenibacillus massiliensis]
MFLPGGSGFMSFLGSASVSLDRLRRKKHREEEGKNRGSDGAAEVLKQKNVWRRSSGLGPAARKNYLLVVFRLPRLKKESAVFRLFVMDPSASAIGLTQQHRTMQHTQAEDPNTTGVPTKGQRLCPLPRRFGMAYPV